MENTELSNFYKDKIIVVTGGTGFIGRHLVTALLELPIHKIIIFDRTIKYEWTKQEDKERIVFIKGDLLCENDMNKIDKLDFNILFHEAAVVDTTCEDENLIYRTNYDAFINLVYICNKKYATMVYASSAAVYGNSFVPNTEWKDEIPLNIYGKSKLKMDHYIIRHKNMFSVPIIGLRYFNVYGPGENHKKKMRSMISQMAEKIAKNETIQLFEFGEQMRDFIYVKDVAYCNLLAGMHSFTTIYNCGTGISVSFNEIYNYLCEAFQKKDVKLEYIKNTYSFFQTHTLANMMRTFKFLEFHPKYTIQMGIADVVHNVADNSMI